MNHLRIVFLALAVVSFSGCISHYRYESRGIVKNAAGEDRGALLYYEEDDGRLWYGKKHRLRDSDVDLKVCQATDKSFVSTTNSDPSLRLKSRGGDVKIAALSEEGTIAQLDRPRRLHSGESCGVVLIGRDPASIDDLDAGTEPKVAILCMNSRRPDRYPDAAVYAFDALTREEVKGDRKSSSPCVEDTASEKAE